MRSTGPPSPDDLSATDVADVLLGLAVRRQAGALMIEAGDDGYRVALDHPGAARGAELASLPPDLGGALVLRLALVAGLDLAALEERIGRARVRLGDREAEFFVVVRTTAAGFGCEVRRVAERGATTAAESPLPDPAAPGSRIGAYRVIEPIGRGGMGVVHRAEHEVLGKQVAIKVLHPRRARDRRLVARFVREGRAASLARHPNIVEVGDFGVTADGRAYLVMELVQGQTLDALLDGGALPPVRALAIARQIAAALEAAHERGVIHRDLKPANVFVGPNDHVKVGDFGAARILDEDGAGPPLTEEGSVIGTPMYMSPEHARALPIDGRTDLYALGCVLFEMLSGAPPFQAPDASQLLLRHIRDPVPPLISPHGPLPAEAHLVVRVALAKRVVERFASAREMIEGLDRVLAALAEGVAGPPETTP